MSEDLLTSRRQPDTDAEALIREARRRQRRRHLVAGLAIVAVAAATAAAMLTASGNQPRQVGHPRPSPSAPASSRVALPGPIPRGLDTTLLMWPGVACNPGAPCGGGPTVVYNLRSRHLVGRYVPNVGFGDYQPLLIHTGRWLVYVGNGATAIGDDLAGKPRVLATTPFFHPSATPGRVWLGYRRGEAGTIRLVPVAGGPPGPPIKLPKGSQLVAGTDTGLLISRLNGVLALWNPGGVPRPLPYAPLSDDGVDASARLVAYGTGCASEGTSASAAYEPNAGYAACRMLRVFDVVSGTVRSFPAPAGTAGWVPGGFNLVHAIAPGDTMIAAYAATRPLGQGRVRLFAMRLRSGSHRPVPVPSSAAHLFARTAWSTRGSWLFYQGPGEHLWAYQVTSGKVRASATACCQYTVLVAYPSHGKGTSGRPAGARR
jgi:hypothetical protein